MGTAMTEETVSGGACRWLLAGMLLIAPALVTQAAEHPSAQRSPSSSHAASLGEAVRRDSKAVAAASKEGAHRVAVAAKAVAHEVATAAKRSAAVTRAAFKGDKTVEPAS